MKRILIFLICLFWAFFVNAQVPAGFPSPSSNGFAKYGYLKTDSAGIAAQRDTTWNPKYVGSWVYWQNPASDSSFWVFNGKTVGKKWDKVVMVSQGNVLGYVPYIGATSNVNLNTKTLFAATLGATDLISPSATANGIVYTNTSGNLTIDTADLTWNDVSKYFGIHTSIPNYPIDIHNNANNMLALNNTATGGAFMLYQTNGTTQWKTGYNSGTNSFDIQNVYSLNTALSFNTGTSLPTFYAPNILMNSGTDSAATKNYVRSLVPSVRYPITSTGFPQITIGLDTGRTSNAIASAGSLNKVRDSLVALISAGGFGTVFSVATTNGAGIISSVANPTTSPNITIRVDTNRTVSAIVTGGSLNKVRDSIMSVIGASLALKLNISDTAAMMSGYRRTSVGILNADLVNSTISGTALGGTLPNLNFGTYLQAGATSYNGTTAVTMTTNATSSNLGTTLVARDANGDFSARNITASLLGNASSSSTSAITDNAVPTLVYPTWVSANTGNLSLQVTSTKLSYNPSTGALSSTSFAGNLSGNATTASTLQTPRTINGVAFDGSANITISASVGNSISAGYGLTGSSYDGSLARTWTADTTKVIPYTDTLAIWGIASKGFVRQFALANYVPYTGATGAVNLGSNTLASGAITSTSSIQGTQIVAQKNDAAASPNGIQIQGSTNTNQQLLIGYNTTSDYGSIQPILQGTGFKNLVLNGAGGSVLIGTTTNHSSEILQVNGTSYLNGATTVNSSVTASSLIKAGGTSSQFLMADGSVTTSATTTNSLTMNNSGSGAASGTTFNGSAAQTISYNTIGAQPQLNGTGFVKASGTTISYDNSTYLTTATAASTYSPIAGSASITTLGTIASGSIPYSLITGTPSLTGYVPYTGATGSVNLGTNTLASGAITSSGFITSTSSSGNAGVVINRFNATSSNAVQWQTTGTNDWFLGSSPTGTATSDLSLYSYGTSSEVLKIARASGNITSIITGGVNLTLQKGTGAYIQLDKTNATAQSWQITGDPNFRIIDATASTVPFQIATSTGAATFSSTITSGDITAGANLITGAGGTSASYYRTSNTSGNFWMGINNSAGSTIGATAYGRFLYSDGAYPLELSTNGIKALTINSSQAATFTSTVNTSSTAASNSTVASNSIYTSGGIGVTGNSIFSSSTASSSTTTGALVVTGGLGVGGSIYATAIFQTSDERLKNIIERNGDLITFTWKDKRDKLIHYGYSAQSINKDYPMQVSKGETWGVNYTEILVKKVNDLELKIKELESKLK